MPELTRLGGRKFILSVLILLIDSLLLIHSDITALIYRDIIIATCAVYIAGNVSQKALTK